jgi:phosphoglycolate phosphatase-like HAD superfamily hydrolase
MKDIQAFFFDFDGVLADSVEVKTKAFAKLFAPFGAEIEAKVIDHHCNKGGMTRADKFRHYYKEFLCEPLSDEILDGLCRKFSHLVTDEVVKSSEIPGAEKFLQEMHNRVPCFVISATPEDEIKGIVKRRKLQEYFERVLGAPATKIENLKSVLIRYDLEPSKSLFFGDAESDYRAAEACGVRFLAILPGPEAPLLNVIPDVEWARDFMEVEKIIPRKTIVEY